MSHEEPDTTPYMTEEDIKGYIALSYGSDYFTDEGIQEIIKTIKTIFLVGGDLDRTYIEYAVEELRHILGPEEEDLTKEEIEVIWKLRSWLSSRLPALQQAPEASPPRG